jgi:hypothetical protein
MKQKSDWKRITLLRKTSFKERLKILAGNNRQPGNYPETGFVEIRERVGTKQHPISSKRTSGPE